MSKELHTQLKNLKNHPYAGAVDKAWLTESKKVLSMQISNTVSASVTKDVQIRNKVRGFLSWYVFGGRPLAITMRVTAAALAILFVPFTTWVTSVNAALLSIPGEPLYNFKIASERVQLSLAGDKQTEIKLRTEFAARRADEIVRLANANHDDAKPHIEKTVQRLSDEIKNVQTGLQNLPTETIASEVVNVARNIDTKTEEIAKVLNKATDIAINVPQIHEVRALVDSVSVQAVETMVKTQKESSEGIVSQKEIKLTIEEKLKTAEVQLDAAVFTVINSTKEIGAPERKEEIKKIEEQVKSAMDAVEKATEEVRVEKFEEALNKIKEVQVLVNETEKIATTVQQTTETPKVTTTTAPIIKEGTSATTTNRTPTVEVIPQVKVQSEVDTVTNESIERLIQQEDRTKEFLSQESPQASTEVIQ